MRHDKKDIANNESKFYPITTTLTPISYNWLWVKMFKPSNMKAGLRIFSIILSILNILVYIPLD